MGDENKKLPEREQRAWTYEELLQVVQSPTVGRYEPSVPPSLGTNEQERPRTAAPSNPWQYPATPPPTSSQVSIAVPTVTIQTSSSRPVEPVATEAEIMQNIAEQLKALEAAVSTEKPTEPELSVEEENSQMQELGWILHSSIPDAKSFSRIVCGNLNTHKSVLAKALFNSHQEKMNILNTEKCDKGTNTDSNDPPTAQKRSALLPQNPAEAKKPKTQCPVVSTEKNFSMLIQFMQRALENDCGNMVISIYTWVKALGVYLLGAGTAGTNTKEKLLQLLNLKNNTFMGSLNFAQNNIQLLQEANELTVMGMKVLVKEKVTISSRYEALLASALQLSVEKANPSYAETLQRWSVAITSRDIDFGIKNDDERNKHILVAGLSDLIFEWPLNTFEGVADCPFLTGDGASTTMPMMRSHATLVQYGVLDESDVLIMNLKHETKIVFIKPKDQDGMTNAAKLLSMDWTHLPQIKARIFLPRVKIERSLCAADLAVEEMSIESILWDRPDFDPLGDVPKDVCVGIVSNTSFEILDRYSEDSKTRGFNEEDVGHVYLDRPFLFAVIHNRQHAVIGKFSVPN